MPIHPSVLAVQQQWSGETFRRGAINYLAHRRRPRDKDDLAALASDAVAMLFAEVPDVGADGLEDPQAQQPQQAHQREVGRVA